MEQVQKGEIDLTTITEEELATLASGGDTEAFALLWEVITPRVKKIIANSFRSQAWLRRQQDDITQCVLLKYPVWIRRYDQFKLSTNFDKWLYHTVRRVTQDVIRAEKDSLGISIPQKKPYPQWNYLSEYASDCRKRNASECDHQSIVLEGIDRLDRGYYPSLGWSESTKE
jgi:DNA-directed RNA polymerase specialized sigma24 family protein